METNEEARAIGEVIERLNKAFPNASPEIVTAAVRYAQKEFEEMPIRDFVPLFVERSAKHRLRHLVSH